MVKVEDGVYAWQEFIHTDERAEREKLLTYNASDDRGGVWVACHLHSALLPHHNLRQLAHPRQCLLQLTDP